jgi:hypothetical protein
MAWVVPEGRPSLASRNEDQRNTADDRTKTKIKINFSPRIKRR